MDPIVLAAGLFMPLFPLSAVFTLAFTRLRGRLMRVVLLLLWPQLGVVLLAMTPAPPRWLAAWALLSATLYAFRALTVRDVALWTAYLSVSSWAVLWVIASGGVDSGALRAYALGFSVPLILLSLLTTELCARFGGAYAGIYGGLADPLPRLAGVLVIVILAVIATPLTPGFFAMLQAFLIAAPAGAGGLALIWLLWSWAGARLVQGLVAGPGNGMVSPDLSMASTWGYGLVLFALMIGGLLTSGYLM